MWDATVLAEQGTALKTNKKKKTGSHMRSQVSLLRCNQQLI